ncbi:MAG: LpxI family protein, partial [Alphaproteobacteria bacterium]|nr:LpxI family protein [Alphaproteobacteria bacterium]
MPRQIVEACQGAERSVHVIAFEGITDQSTVQGVNHTWQRLAAVGGTIDALKKAGADELVLAGHIARPSLSSLRPDWRGMTMLPKLMAAGQGDDAILSTVLAELEGEGFRVVGAHDV